jgi:hypothetical protein
MADIDYHAQFARLMKDAKRNCLFCYGRSRLRNTDNERDTAMAKIKEMYRLFDDYYNEARRKDAAVQYIKKALENKRLCLDAVDACRGCDRTIDHINRQVMKFEQ